MEYFYISQDKQYMNTPYIENFYKYYYPNMFCPEQSDRIPDNNVVYTKRAGVSEYIDLLSAPILLVSLRMKRVLEAYDDLLYKMFFILNLSSDQGEIYYAPIVEKEDCLKIKKEAGKTCLVLSESKAAGKSILKPAKVEFRGGLVIDMMVAESLLRRELRGIHYQRLEVE